MTEERDDIQTMIEQARMDRALTPAEVAEIFAVDPKTVTRWAQRGLLPSQRTPGGHRRFRESVIRRLIAESEMREDG